jgi:hypothetical protein
LIAGTTSSQVETPPVTLLVEPTTVKPGAAVVQNSIGVEDFLKQRARALARMVRSVHAKSRIDIYSNSTITVSNLT